jgi:hypothetical protein
MEQSTEAVYKFAWILNELYYLNPSSNKWDVSGISCPELNERKDHGILSYPGRYFSQIFSVAV